MSYMEAFCLPLIDGLSHFFLLLGWGIFFWLALWQIVKLRRWNVDVGNWSRHAFSLSLVGLGLRGVLIVVGSLNAETDWALGGRILWRGDLICAGLSLVLMWLFLKNTRGSGISDAGRTKLRRLSSVEFPCLIVLITVYAVDGVMPRFGGEYSAIFPLYVIVTAAVMGLVFIGICPVKEKDEARVKLWRREKGALLLAFVMLRVFFLFCMLVVDWYKGGTGLSCGKQDYIPLATSVVALGIIPVVLLMFSRIRQSIKGIWIYSVIICMGICVEFAGWSLMLKFSELSLVSSIVTGVVSGIMCIAGGKKLLKIRRECNE